jgi:hypothetical protein
MAYRCGKTETVTRQSDSVKPRNDGEKYFVMPDIMEIKVVMEGRKMEVWGREPGTEVWYRMESM